MTTDSLSCDDWRSVSAELALGLLTGKERAAALAHVETCVKCRELLVELGHAADRLLVVAPRREPSLGFEERVLALIDASASPEQVRAQFIRQDPATTPRRRVRLLVAVGAAAACFLVAAGGWAGSTVWSESHPHVVALRTATAMSAGPEQATCRVVLMRGRPGWVLVAIDEPGGDTDSYPVSATVRSPGASDVNVDLGSLATTAGHGVLAVNVSDADLVRRIIVTDSSGIPKYTLRPTR